MKPEVLEALTTRLTMLLWLPQEEDRRTIYGLPPLRDDAEIVAHFNTNPPTRGVCQRAPLHDRETFEGHARQFLDTLLAEMGVTLLD